MNESGPSELRQRTSEIETEKKHQKHRKRQRKGRRKRQTKRKKQRERQRMREGYVPRVLEVFACTQIHQPSEALTIRLFRESEIGVFHWQVGQDGQHTLVVFALPLVPLYTHTHKRAHAQTHTHTYTYTHIHTYTESENESGPSELRQRTREIETRAVPHLTDLNKKNTLMTLITYIYLIKVS